MTRKKYFMQCVKSRELHIAYFDTSQINQFNVKIRYKNKKTPIRVTGRVLK
jgi:hypothetical protein